MSAAPRERVALGLLVLAIAALLRPAHVAAHRGSTKQLLVEATDEGARVRVDVELVDAALELGLEESEGERVLDRGAELARVLATRVHVDNADGPCTVVPREVTSPLDVDAAGRVSIDLAFTCSARRPLTLTDDSVFPADAQHEAFVRERFGTGAETFVLRRGRQSVELGRPATSVELALRFAWEGVVHLVTGYDHILFLLSLLLTSGERAKREGRRRAFLDVASVVTAFTVGHSVTLVLAALDVVVLPSRWVETAIAASIALVAALNIARPEARAPMPWIALGFGLIHGFGFSGVLAELGLPERARLVSLFAFNVGIEAAQLAIVLVLLAPLEWLAGRAGYRRWVVRGGSIAIGALALVWMVERALGRG